MSNGNENSADRAVNETRRTWRPRLPGGGCTHLERLAVFYPGCVIIAPVLPGTEDSGGAENAGVENAGVENAGAIVYGKPSEEKTLRYQ